MADLADLIAPGAVLHKARAAGKRELLESLAAIAAQEYGVNAALAHEAAMERERLGGTGVGEGVAVPHARVRDLPRPAVVVALLDAPIDFDGPDGRPADIVFLLLSPEDAGADHLKSLARVTRVLRKAEVRQALRAARSAPAAFALLTADTPVKAA